MSCEKQKQNKNARTRTKQISAKKINYLKMIADQQLISFHIIQRDINNKCLMTWSYPIISEENKTYLLEKCFKIIDKNEFICLHKNEWFYIKQSDTINVPNIKSFAIILLAKNFNLNKYKLFCDILHKKYLKSNNPVELVKIYLNVFTSGTCCIQENGTLVTHNLRDVKENFKIKELVKLFGREIVLVYTALLLKTRVLVYYHDLQQLQMYLLSITKLMPHRCVNDYLYPFITNVANELRGLNFYVAGITNKNQSFKVDCYDIFINLHSREIVVAPKAKEKLTMTKTHKDIALLLVELSEKDISDEEVVIAISNKTQELLKQLKSLAIVKTATGNMITLENLRSRKYNQNLENFLFNLAVAENIMMV